MADIKTTCRELSVAITLGLYIRNVEFDLNDLLIRSKFLGFLETLDISGDFFPIKSEAFDNSEIAGVISNGYKLGTKIFDCGFFDFHENDRIIWTGADVHNGDPTDLIVGNYSFSLKEDSYILHNMGLYSFLNVLTDSKYKPGLHVFKTFAPQEYNDLFIYTWRHFVEFLNENKIWSIRSEPLAIASIEKDDIKFVYDDELPCYVSIFIDSFDDYMKATTSHVREKIFAKWISAEFSNDPGYLVLKRACSQNAGEKIVNIVNNNFRYSNLSDFFRFQGKEYYYAKVTNSDVHLYLVPAISDLTKTIKFLGCQYSIPESQLNIMTIFENRQTKKKFVFRNECRFSHGQFNGTPEAKLYIDKKSNFTDLYVPIF